MMKHFTFFPATLLLLAILSGVAWLTGTHVTFLPNHVLYHIGFAPVDLLQFNWERILTSLFVTTGPGVFWLAFVMITLAAGIAEWRCGSLRTLLTFFGAHITTLFLLSLIALPLHWFDFSFGSLVALSRDVGPSAGYFGTLGLALASFQARRRWVIGGGVMLFLLTALLTETSDNPGMEYSADLAHIIAFPLGWASYRLRRPARHDEAL